MYADDYVEQYEDWVYNKPIPLLELSHVWRCIEKRYDKYEVDEIVGHTPYTCLQCDLSFHRNNVNHGILFFMDEIT